MTCLDVML